MEKTTWQTENLCGAKMGKTYRYLGDMLVGEGLVTKDQVDRVLEARKRSQARLGELLIAMGLLDEFQLRDCLAEQYAIPVADLSTTTPDSEALGLIPSFNALMKLVLPVKLEGNELHCVIADPLDLPMTDELSRDLRVHIRTSLAAPSDLYDAIVRSYGLNVPLKGAAPLAGVRSTPKKNASVQEDRQALLAGLDTAFDFLGREGLSA